MGVDVASPAMNQMVAPRDRRRLHVKVPSSAGTTTRPMRGERSPSNAIIGRTLSGIGPPIVPVKATTRPTVRPPVTRIDVACSSGQISSALGVDAAPHGGTTSPLTVTGLTTNTTYSIDLRAVNSVGGGTTPPAPVIVTPGAPKTPSAPPPTFPPAPPTSVTAVAGDRSAVVTWQTPENAGSFAITHYQVISTPGSHTCLTTTTTCVVDDLEPGVAYTFTVRGLNGVGRSSGSSTSR